MPSEKNERNADGRMHEMRIFIFKSFSRVIRNKIFRHEIIFLSLNSNLYIFLSLTHSSAPSIASLRLCVVHMHTFEHPPAAEHWQHKIARKFTAKANKNIGKTLKCIEKHWNTYIPTYSIAIGIACNIENETRRKTKLSIVQLCSELFSWDFVAFGEGLQSADFSHKT